MDMAAKSGLMAIGMKASISKESSKGLEFLAPLMGQFIRETSKTMK